MVLSRRTWEASKATGLHPSFLLMTVCLKSSLTQCYIWPDQIWIRSLTSDRKVITTLEKSLQGKESQIQQLEKQLADMSHLHQTEIVKLRLEVGRSNICAKRGVLKGGFHWIILFSLFLDKEGVTSILRAHFRCNATDERRLLSLYYSCTMSFYKYFRPIAVSRSLFHSVFCIYLGSLTKKY